MEGFVYLAVSNHMVVTVTSMSLDKFVLEKNQPPS